MFPAVLVVMGVVLFNCLVVLLAECSRTPLEIEGSLLSNRNTACTSEATKLSEDGPTNVTSLRGRTKSVAYASCV